MIACPKCGFDNELGRIFCHQCGAKLDLNAVKPPGQGGPKIRRRRKWTVGSVVRHIIELGVVALIAWAVYLMFQVPDVKFGKPTNAELLSADDKRLTLDQIVLRQKPASLEVTEGEFNALVGSAGFDKPKGSGLELVPTSFQSKFSDGVVEMDYLGNLNIGPSLSKKLYLSFTGVPVVEENYFEFRPVAAAIGQLPIHPKIVEMTHFFQDRFLRIFGKLHHEYELLEKLNSISVTRGKAVLSYQPPPPATASQAPAR